VATKFKNSEQRGFFITTSVPHTEWRCYVRKSIGMGIGSGSGDKLTRFMGLFLRHSETKQGTEVFLFRNDAAGVGSDPKTHLSDMRKQTTSSCVKRMRDNLHVKAPVAMLIPETTQPVQVFRNHSVTSEKGFRNHSVTSEKGSDEAEHRHIAGQLCTPRQWTQKRQRGHSRPIPETSVPSEKCKCRDRFLMFF
jgi:hypothetical protein